MKDLNLIRERDEFMVKCRSYHGDKMKVGKSRLPKVETVTDDEDEVASWIHILIWKSVFQKERRISTAR